MENYFSKVKDYLLDLEVNITSENEEEGLFIIDDEESGIKNMIIIVEEPILEMVQVLFEIKADNPEIYKALLQKNRDIIHGAFVLDETGKKVLFRDTLQIENLDFNELEGSLNALSLLLSEYSNEIIKFAK